MKIMAQKTTFQHKRLATLREVHKVTQQELADAIKADVKSISRELIKDFEIGSRIPKIDVVVAFAKYFKVSTDYLFGLTDTPTKDTDIRMISDYTGLSENVILNLHWRNMRRRERLEEAGSLDATDEMLGKLLNSLNDSLSLSVPIMQKANRIAVEYIAKQIIENPKRFVPMDKEGEMVLDKILSYIDQRFMDSIAHPEELGNEMADTHALLILSRVTDILGRYIDIQGSAEFDRFESTQAYLDAYDAVMAKYPERKLIELQKRGLLGNIGLRYVSGEADTAVPKST